MTKNHDDGTSILDDYRSKGFAGRVGFGQRPAIVVVDFIVGFTDSESPLAGELDSQIEATTILLETARSRSIPVFFTSTVYEPDWIDGGFFVVKIPSLKILVRGCRWIDVDPRLNRQHSEPIIEKQYASAFFGTSLASTLTAGGIDTVIVAGCTTSGCVRATVVDALQNGFRAIIPPECVGDRSAEQHAANLIDMDGKYGDVVDLADVITYFEGMDGAP